MFFQIQMQMQISQPPQRRPKFESFDHCVPYCTALYCAVQYSAAFCSTLYYIVLYYNRASCDCVSADSCNLITNRMDNHATQCHRIPLLKKLRTCGLLYTLVRRTGVQKIISRNTVSPFSLALVVVIRIKIHFNIEYVV